MISLQLVPIVHGLTDPVTITTAILPNSHGQSLFVATSSGEIFRVHPDGTSEIFLDISDLTTGLFGIVFHPKFCQNGRFYLYYAMSDSDTSSPEVISPHPRYPQSLNQIWTDQDQYDHINTLEEWVLHEKGPTCARTLLNLKWPFSNHNGNHTLGWYHDKLSLITGDGGSEYDPFHLAQDNLSLLGKILLIDINLPPWHYSDNPPPAVQLDQLDKVRQSSLEIVAKGIQNPNHLLMENIVGHLADHQKIILFKKTQSNLGWPSWDGKLPTTYCREILYHHEAMKYHPCGLKIHYCGSPAVGGIVYHGKNIPELRGYYIFAERDGSIFYLDPNWDQPKILLMTSLEFRVIGTNCNHSRIFFGTTDGLYELQASSKITQDKVPINTINPNEVKSKSELR